jgi:triosephosphate isomerase (TIM)
MEERFLILANWKNHEAKMYGFVPPENLEVAIAPQIPQIPQIPPQFVRAAQDVGESAQKLKEWGVKYCLVGHSYRRNNFGETNEIVAQKVAQLQKIGIIPIVCARSLAEIVPAEMIMYEPEEAISTNGRYHPATPEQINKALAAFPENSRLLYGGSVNPENCKMLIEKCKTVSGFVVGHASLDEREFSRIISSVYAAKT